MSDFIHELIIMMIATLVVFAIIAIKDKFTYTDEELKEMEEWDVTLMDGLEDEPEWWGGNNDNPDTNTTSETDTTGNPNTNTTDETPELTQP